MKVGVNLPWKNYGWDLGVGPWAPRRAWEPGLVDALRALRELGVHAVRWFVLGDGLTYGTGDDAPRPDPARAWHGHPQWRFVPPRGDAVRPLLEDFRALLEGFRRAADDGRGAVTLLPVVLDFGMFFQGNHESGPFAKTAGGPPPPAGFVKNGRVDLAIDPRKTQDFLEHLLAPMVAVAREPALRPFVHSFDLFNEPEWCTDDGRRAPTRTVPLARMIELLRAMRDVVQPHHRATVGFAEHETLHKWPVASLGLSYGQFHYYAKPAMVPVADGACSVVGEFASAPGAAAPPGVDRTWPELGGPRGDQRLLRRLQLLEAKGYAEAFVWSCQATDDATRWDDDARADVAAFTGRAP